MATIVPFPQSNKSQDAAFSAAAKSIEKRMGVPIMDYMGFTGNKQETKEKVARAMRKETLTLASKFINEKPKHSNS